MVPDCGWVGAGRWDKDSVMGNGRVDAERAGARSLMPQTPKLSQLRRVIFVVSITDIRYVGTLR